MEYNTFIMLGKPGSGKGEQSKLLSQATGFPIFSFGQKFREITAQETYLAGKVKDVIDKGFLMPHWFASYLLLETMLKLEEKDGIILDGGARKYPEAELFYDVATWMGRPYKAIYIKVSDEVAVERIMKRKQIEGRSDDVETAIRVRLQEYHHEAEPAIEYLRDKGGFLEIDGEKEIDDVRAEIMRGIGLS